MKRALELLMNDANQPILVMCECAILSSVTRSDGFSKTGVIIGCYRRLQNWCVTSIIQEVGVLPCIHRSTDASTTTRRAQQTPNCTLSSSLPNSFPCLFVEQRSEYTDKATRLEKRIIDIEIEVEIEVHIAPIQVWLAVHLHLLLRVLHQGHQR